MFWRFGGYASISTIDTILEKDNFELEDLLDENDLIQELKQHNAKLVEYLRDQNVLEKLLEYVVAPKLAPVATRDEDDDDDDEDDEKGKSISLPFARSRASSQAAEIGSDEDNEKRRNRYAFVAAEILASDNWSICEALMESRSLLRNFWQFLKRPAPLDPLQASYFTKVNESLFDKKTEDMLDLLKSMDGAIVDILKHVDCPMIMDLLLKIISLERTESGQGIIEWLYTQDVIPILLSFLGPEHSWATQTSAGDFMKAIITVSANASQNEQTCIGPNELTRQLVSRPCVEQLIKYMLGGGNPLTCGVGIVIEVIRKNNSDYDPDNSVEAGTTPSSRDPIYLGTLLRLFAEHVPDFMNLIMNAPAQKERLNSTFGGKIEPLGFDRFKTCELMAELLHCSNMGLLNEVGSEEFIASRDALRQRLRAEGCLQPQRGEEAPSSVEELTMRSSASPEAVRKLEVTNISADDDGFEEVTHTADEDSSHGVEELPEVPMPGPTSSFLDKDEDDFVDEPLSSPRLNVQDVEKDPDFDQDLIVAPLSPSKKRPTEPAAPSAPSAAEPIAKLIETNLSLEDLLIDEKVELETETKTEKAAEKETASENSDTDTPLLTPATSEPEPRAAEPLNVEPVKIPASPEEMSPHPEDTPAPLFSGQRAPAPTDTTLPAVTPQAEDAEAAESEGDSPTRVATAAETSAAPDAAETSVAAETNESTSPEDSPATPKPVVGDYLKMQFVDNRVVPTILGFFFSYPWNNFLHNVVYDIVQQVFNGPMDRGYNPTLAISLFESADIANQIINGQMASEKSQTENKTRMGYMGHLTLIAEEVVKFTERHPPELLSDIVLEKVMAQDWINYVEGALAETRERDNAILGGVRPDVAHANRAGAGLAGMGLSGLGSIGLGGNGTSNALAEAGLNGGQDLSDNAGSGIGPFAISAGTLMSGFGSSSDEDEDEEQDNEEDVNSEFRAYTDPLNANNGNSMNPPSIPPPPPPPPPLNVPPSRARLQLAARLAMNKRNAAAAAAAANGSQESSSSAGETSGISSFALPTTSNDRLRNPFADDEDDDEGSGSGSDDGELDNLGNDAGSSGWNRGSWWRGVVRSARRNNRRSLDKDTGREERFGDGRDDSDDSDGPDDDADDIEDEEFGDFAMPEATPAPTSIVSGIDPAREKILLKPMAVHPSAVKTSSFGSLWPFNTQSFGSKGLDRKDDIDLDKTPTQEKAPELPLKPDDGAEVVGEDGKKIDRAVEAKSRTSIEDPDEDDVVVGEEIIVGRSAAR